jgi:hypothetical protein
MAAIAGKAAATGPGQPARAAGRPRPVRAGERMSDLKELSRVLCDHQWETTADWVSKLDQLADLSDDEIGRLVRLSTARPRRPGK